MEDDLGVDLLEMLGFFGGVDERDEVGFRGGLIIREGVFENGGGFGGKRVWSGENRESSHSL